MRNPENITVNGKRLSEILENHKKWLFSNDGEKANLRGADLSGVYLNGVDLSGADLSGGVYLNGANLSGADFGGADLSGAYLGGADLSGASLNGADLSGASLNGADFRGANLNRANLRGADLSGVYLNGVDLSGAENNELAFAMVTITPMGTFDAFKKAYFKITNNPVILRLRIPAKAKRSNASGRKCRAEYVKVLALYDLDGNKFTSDAVFINRHGPTTEYKVGKTVHCDKWDDDRWNECSGGIHFFLTFEEAKEW